MKHATLALLIWFSAWPVQCLSAEIPIYAWYFRAAQPKSEAFERIRYALRAPLPAQGLEFVDVPLEEILATVSAEYDIEIVVDGKALQQLGISHDQTITCSIQNMSIGSALTHLLKEAGLTHAIAKDVLLITTPAEAQKMLIVCVYPVHDLLEPTYKPTQLDKSLRIPAELVPLANTLITTVASDTWAENGGGNASISGMQPGLLIISQTQPVHEEIIDTLTAIREAKKFAEHKMTEAKGASSELEGGSSSKTPAEQ